MKVGLFVDANNLFYMQRKQGWWVDLSKFRWYFGERQGKQICECYYFTGMPSFRDKERVEKQRHYCNWLTRIGYTVVQKELKVVGRDNRGQEKRKANLDIELTLRVIQSLPHCDELILVEGDGDFAPLVHHARENGKRVVCVASRNAMALELQNAATEFVDLASIRTEIEDTRPRQ
jgi:uncharacterized LabA/DUF88 family protein